jgi:hypothetical protein
MAIGWFLAMPTSIANCVDRIPDFCMVASYMRVTARAVLLKLNDAQYPVPVKSSLHSPFRI